MKKIRCTSLIVSVKTQVGHANVKFRGGSGIVQLKTRLAEESAVIVYCWNSEQCYANCTDLLFVRVGEVMHRVPFSCYFVNIKCVALYILSATIL